MNVPENSVLRFIYLQLFYLRLLLKTNVQIAKEVVRPTPTLDPTLVWIDAGTRLSEPKTFILANLITLTPGSICLDYDEEKNSYLVHLMYREDEDETRAMINTFSESMGGPS